MGVYIPNMEMPKNCLTCACTDSEWGDCVLDPEKRCPDDYKKRAEWCPLVEIPPHGRLIDADAFLADMACAVATKMQIEDAPTVIESTIGQLNSDPAVNEAEEGE